MSENEPQPASRVTVTVMLLALGGVLAAGVLFVNDPLPTSTLHVRAAFAGSSDNLLTLTGSEQTLTAGMFRSSLLRDMVFALVYGALLVAMALMRDGLRVARWSGLQDRALTLAVLAVAADLAENVVMFHSLHDAPETPGLVYSSDRAALVVMALSLLKFVALVAALVLTVVRWWSVMAPRTKPGTAVPGIGIGPAGNGDYGICCSGGGIRAAAFSLGALHALETAGGRVRRARYMTAVSGGNFAASGWVTTAMTTGPDDAAATLLRRLQEPSATPPDGALERDHSARQRHRYLKNGRGGLPRALAWAAGIVLLHVVVLLSFVFAVSWPIGRAMRTETLADGRFPVEFVLERRDWVPALLVAGLAVMFGVLALLVPVARSWCRRAALATVAVSAVGLVVMLVLPWALVTVRNLFTDKVASGSPENAAWSIAGISAAGFAGWVWAMVKGKVMRGLPYLGGVILALVLALFGGKVANDAATATGWFDASAAIWLVVVVALGLAYVGPGIQWASFRPIYARGLRGSFGAPVPPAGATAPPVTWEALAAMETMPELIVCCAAQRVGLSRNGVPARSFTISQHRVAVDDEVVLPSAAYLAHVPDNLRPRMAEPVAWMAVSGAAVASAMGRLSKGTTNAVFAGLGVNLGLWIPSPWRVRDGRIGFPRARMGYYVKEILGEYDKHDDFVFVADGGHWDNLGLVELLRRQCPRIVCLDASGDQPGSFTTFRQAVALALTELPNVVTFGLDELENANKAPVGLLPPTSVMTISVTYTGGAKGTILYANVRVAADQHIDIRRFARLDAKFPHYSTGDQFLDDQQFEFLVRAGREAGAVMAAKLDATDPS